MPLKHYMRSQEEPSSSAAAVYLGPNLPFISSQIGRVSKLDTATCTPDGFEIWKQRWDSCSDDNRLLRSPAETKLAPFINVISDNTLKRMNNIGHQQVNVIIGTFQNKACGSSTIYVHE